MAPTPPAKGPEPPSRRATGGLLSDGFPRGPAMVTLRGCSTTCHLWEGSPSLWGAGRKTQGAEAGTSPRHGKDGLCWVGEVAGPATGGTAERGVHPASPGTSPRQLDASKANILAKALCENLLRARVSATAEPRLTCWAGLYEQSLARPPTLSYF